MGDYNEVDKIEISSTQKFDDIICETEQRIKECCKHKAALDHKEFEQFKKSWFFHNWKHRFQRLGNVGVISIPNTTLEEWIYWLYEWSIKFTDDYNKFKKLVWEAIKLHEEHLNILDNQVKDLQERVEELERQINLIWQKINEILEQINHLWAEVNNIKNEINNLHNKDNDLQDQINNFKENVFNTSFNNAVDGTLKNGWYMKHENPTERFAIGWDWNNKDNHSQGVHWALWLNYLYKDDCPFSGNLNDDSLIGEIPNINAEQWKIGETWLYSGYIVQSYPLVGNMLIHIVPKGDILEIRVLNVTRGPIPEGNFHWQVNFGGISTQYIL